MRKISMRPLAVLAVVVLAGWGCDSASGGLEATENLGDCHPCGVGTEEDQEQNITIAFDIGLYDEGMWQETMRLAREIEHEFDTPLHFTYFISTAAYLPDPPPNTLGLASGHITAREALRQWAYTQMAINEGHEIGSHTVSHFNGGEWSVRGWTRETELFHEHVGDRLFEPRFGSDGMPLFPRWDCDSPLESSCDVVLPVLDTDGMTLFDEEGRANPEAVDAGRLVPYDVVGFRAPYLEGNAELIQVLAAKGYQYDASGNGPLVWPRQHRSGLWLFPVQVMRRTNRNILGMDYNFYFNRVPAKEMEDVYGRTIQEAYEGDRHPVFLCHHFRRYSDAGGTPYWSALQNTIRAAASQDGVRFPSNRELAEKLALSSLGE